MYDMDMFLYEFHTATKIMKARVRSFGGKEEDYCLKYSEFEVSIEQWFSKRGSQGNSSITQELARRASLWARYQMYRSQNSWWQGPEICV